MLYCGCCLGADEWNELLIYIYIYVCVSVCQDLTAVWQGHVA